MDTGIHAATIIAIAKAIIDSRTEVCCLEMVTIELLQLRIVFTFSATLLVKHERNADQTVYHRRVLRTMSYLSICVSA